MHSLATRQKIGDALFRGVYFNCDFCGQESRTSKSHYDKKKLHFCSNACYTQYKLVRPPELHPRWQGGITKETQRGRGSKAYKEWQLAVFTRDGLVCIRCGDNNNLEADHIKGWARHPELRYTVSNGRTLCHDCHRKPNENKELLK